MKKKKEFKGHGWQFCDRDTIVSVGRLPHRKQLCLYVVRGSILEVLAFIKTKEQAEKILALLDLLAPLKKDDMRFINKHFPVVIKKVEEK